jgi:hypothetical protein
VERSRNVFTSSATLTARQHYNSKTLLEWLFNDAWNDRTYFGLHEECPILNKFGVFTTLINTPPPPIQNFKKIRQVGRHK